MAMCKICLCFLHRKMFVFQDVIIDWYFLFHKAAACINTDASDGSDKADAIRKTQNTDSTAAQTRNQGQSKLTQSTENCSATNKTKCNSLQNGHIQRKSQSGDCSVIEVLPNPSTAAETESRASQAGASKTHTSAVRNKRTQSKSGSDQPNAAALECEHIVLQHCLPPPYVQPPPHPLASSSSVCVRWASARSESTAPTAAPETSRPVHPTCVNSFVPEPRTSPSRDQHGRPPQDTVIWKPSPSPSVCLWSISKDYVSHTLFPVGLGDMSKNSHLCIFWLICGIQYVSRYFVFGLNK